MSDRAHTAYEMISGMTPVLRPEVYVFVTTQDVSLGAELAPQAISTFREDEGLSLLVTDSVEQASGFTVDSPMRCITLNVYSSLDGVGLTAAVAGALAKDDIPCNMIAAYNHDHAFVPSDMVEKAMEVLAALQNQTTKPD